MQLVNMDVERLGNITAGNRGQIESIRWQLGPFSPGLNAIYGPRGAGKTTLLHWLRTVTSEQYGASYVPPQWAIQPQALTGMVEIVDRQQHYRASSDRNGAVRVELLDPAHRVWPAQPFSRFEANGYQRQLSPQQLTAFSALNGAHGNSDTESNLREIASRLGLDEATERPYASERQQLLARKSELQRRVEDLASVPQSREYLAARRSELERELSSIRNGIAPYRSDEAATDYHRFDERMTVIQRELQQALDEVNSLDSELANCQAELKATPTEAAPVNVDESYRLQLQQLDDRLNRWRQTLRDLKAHRERIEHDATDAQLDKQIGEQLSVTKDSDPRAALRSLEVQIVSTRKQIDELIGRYGGMESLAAPQAYDVVRDANGETRIAYTDAHRHLPESLALPETLRAMQKDLYEVCQQLARHESQSTCETLKTQALQLKRAESELLESVQKLIEERAALLRRIAAEYHLSVDQLTLAFGEWCQCQDHPHLQDWLLSDESGKASACGVGTQTTRHGIAEQIASITSRRKQAMLRVEDCRRQLRDADIYRQQARGVQHEVMGRREVDLLRELDQQAAQLKDWETRDRLTAELHEVERQLDRTPVDSPAVNSTSFQTRYNGHVAALMGRIERQSADRSYRTPAAHRFDLVDGVVRDGHAQYETYEKVVPNAIVRLALRLAIAESLLQRGESICLLLDDALSELTREHQQRAIAHLATVASTGQQVILLTSDRALAELVRECQGWVGNLIPDRAPVRQGPDINQQLSAIANDHEADKWYQPDWANGNHREVRSEYYLTEHSPIDDAPSIDANSASRCRGLGVVCIGDLLDIEPNWLAENLRIEGIHASTVTRWQAEVRLLCSVRKLRPFDARVLVGAGIRSPQQLAEVHPSHLLQRVEKFLTTERGRRIMNSGSSRELSRITTWIASAKSGPTRYERTSIIDDLPDDYVEYESAGRSEYESSDESDYTRSARSSSSKSRSRSSGQRRSSNGASDSSGNQRRRTEDSRDASRSSRNGTRASRQAFPKLRQPELNGSGRAAASNGAHRESTESSHGRASSRETVRIVAETAEPESQLKFYLELSSPVVDAPSIGPRMATRLEKVGIFTVDQLLAADPEFLADKLDNRRVSSDTVLAWQLQAQLVCRIPNLRGHDAQMLVACELTAPEELMDIDPQDLLDSVVAYAQSTEGQRILRGSKEPDLEEVNNWISWAASCRSLNAA
ncbi:DUF4332 domain-containing protein [Aureliella helgolandensis]|uniref:Pathogenicity locus n=1 Tax=Aureliella helgolandensis TaxID=2527968 RepID=A0A518G2Z6_9BACT|nr:DUF4332 domain-containing protein [Aureliella helgolandensis]QDV22977.1 hypothetical protein Q31a_12700 [Aureliella helgolandensis]